MEQLWIEADQFRKQGQLQDKDLEEIIKEIKEDVQFKNEEEDRQAESTRDKQWFRGKVTSVERRWLETGLVLLVVTRWSYMWPSVYSKIYSKNICFS